MDKKKGIIAIVLFVFLGLMVFSFANPADEESTTKLDGVNNNNVQENVDDNSTNDDTESTLDEETNSINSETTNRTTSSSSSTTNSELSNNSITTGNDNETETTTDTTNNDNSSNDNTNTNSEKNYDSIKTLVANLETLVNAALESTELTDMDEARDYNVNEKIASLVNAIDDEELKEVLTKKLEEIYVILNDEEKPVVDKLGILNLTHYKNGGDLTVANVGDKIRVLVYFKEELNVAPKMTIKGVDKELTLYRSSALSNEKYVVYYYDYTITENDTIKDGNLEIKIYGYKDMSNNVGDGVTSEMEDIRHKSYPYVNFDTEAPEINLLQGERFTSKIIEVNDENFDYMTIKRANDKEVVTITDVKEKYEIKEESDSEDTLYVVKAYDKAGNETINYNVYVDNVIPVITGTGLVGEKETEFTNEGIYKSVNLNVIDKNLKIVEIYKDEVLVETKIYKWNEDKTCMLSYQEDGVYKIIVTDRANQKVEYTFTIDTTPAVLGAANILVNGDSNEQKEFWATNGDEIYAYVRVSEELKNTPTFTFHNNGKDYVVNASDVVLKTNDKGEYTYSVLYPITEDLDMVDGEITLTVSNLVDLAGNVTNIVLKPTNGHIVTLDRTAPSIKWNDTIYTPDQTDTIYTNEQFIAEVIDETSGIDKIYYNGHDRTSVGKINVNGDSSYKFKLIDKAGNEVVYNVVIDRVEAKDVSSDFFVNGQGAKKVYTATNNNTVTVNLKTNEELKNVPTFTFHNNSKDYVVEGKYSGQDGKGSYTYTATLKVTDELSNGELTYTISNIVDLAGNVKTTDITKPSNGRQVFIDNVVEVEEVSSTSKNIDESDPTYNSEICGGNEFVCEMFNTSSVYTFTFEEPVKLVSIKGTNSTIGDNNQEKYTASASALYGLSTTDYSTNISINFNQILWFDFDNYIKSDNTVFTFEDELGNKINIDSANGESISVAVSRTGLNFAN